MSSRYGIVDMDKYDLPDKLAERLLTDGDKFISKEQSDAYKDKFINRYVYEGKFVNLMDEKLKELSSQLTLSQLGLFASLTQFMDFKTKNIVWRGKPMTQSDISLSVGVNPYTVSKHLKGLVDTGFIYKDRDGKGATYKLNEDLVFIGKFLKDEYSTKLFTTRFKELIHELKLNEVGLFYRLVPYLNTELYVLSHNPHEMNTNEINPLSSYQSIADTIGMERSGVQKIMNKLMKNDLIYMVQGKKKVFVFNPEVVTRKPKMDSLEKILEVVRNKYE